MFQLHRATISIAVFAGALTACNPKTENPVPERTLFTELPASQTGIQFSNTLKDDPKFNVFNYRNFYNGGGVAIGDINGDSLADVFLVSNMDQNKLFLNKGNWKFEDITQKAGVGGTRAWSTGVAMADVNGDGLLDIYVCNSGNVDGDDKENELFINQGNLTFKEEAVAYGLADIGLTTHATFFDYDLDGDLDCYVLNNSYRAIGSFGLKQNLRDVRSASGGDKLYRNDSGTFTDVSEKAGIYGSEIGFGLGISVADVNGDVWPDIYISNDFFEKDYLYINQRNGTFRESIENYMGHLSLSSMGSDIADINNDGLPDLFTSEMLPEDDKKLKSITRFEDYDIYNAKIKGDYYNQYIQNCLHLNNGDSTFSEIAFLANVAATDWSWGGLFFDFNNDGWKDLFVSNGIYKDITDQDYIEFLADGQVKRRVAAQGQFNYKELLAPAPSNPIPNYAFLNNKDLFFKNEAARLGLAKPGFSSGSAYGDLDNDGDLDLVVNNLDAPVSVYRNNVWEFEKPAFLKIKFEGAGANRFGIGSQVQVAAGGQVITQYQMLSRGFQSSVDPVMTIGLGAAKQINSVVVVWPDLKKQTFINPPINQTLTVKQASAGKLFQNLILPKPLYVNISKTAVQGIATHAENYFIDFDRERLLPHLVSMEGPRCAVGDVDGDGLDDVFVGGAKNDSGKLFLQRANGFERAMQSAFDLSNSADQVGTTMFDADGDGDQDLFVAYGGNEDEPGSFNLSPFLYLNDGKGRFTLATGNLPPTATNASCVRPGDVDGDGDLDLFIGGRSVAGKFGVNPRSYLLLNDGNGRFTDQTVQKAPELQQVGMVTDAVWQDTDRDGRPDLVVVGEWMPLTIFQNTGTTLQKKETVRSDGWWNCVKAADVDGDGDWDLVLGNLGLNSKIKGTEKHPAQLLVNDFDGNGQMETVLAYYKSDSNAYLLHAKPELTAQMPGLRKKFLRYADYAGKKMDEVFESDQLRGVQVKKAYQLQSCVALNDGRGNFALTPLPLRAQFAPVYAILAEDLDGDGRLDLLCGGNFFGVKPEIGRYDASYTTFLKGDGRGNFTFVPNSKTGLIVKNEIRDIVKIKTPKGEVLLFAKNNEPIEIYRRNF